MSHTPKQPKNFISGEETLMELGRERKANPLDSAVDPAYMSWPSDDVVESVREVEKEHFKPSLYDVE